MDVNTVLDCIKLLSSWNFIKALVGTHNLKGHWKIGKDVPLQDERRWRSDCFAVCKYLPQEVDFLILKNLFNLTGKNVAMFSSRKQTLDKFELEIRHTFWAVKILNQSNSLPRDMLESYSLPLLKYNLFKLKQVSFVSKCIYTLMLELSCEDLWLVL